jgi:hypothetical protein
LFVGWLAGFLGMTLVPHAIIGAVRHWPPGLVSAHAACFVLAGLTAVMARTVTKLQRRALADELERVERRLRQS